MMGPTSGNSGSAASAMTEDASRAWKMLLGVASGLCSLLLRSRVREVGSEVIQLLSIWEVPLGETGRRSAFWKTFGDGGTASDDVRPPAPRAARGTPDVADVVDEEDDVKEDADDDEAAEGIARGTATEEERASINVDSDRFPFLSGPNADIAAEFKLDTRP